MNLTRYGINKIQELFLIFFIILFFSCPAHSGCGNIPSSHALYSDSEIKLAASNITMNGNSLINGTYSPKAAIAINGNINTGVNLSFPDLDPNSFPSNSSNNVVDITSTQTLTNNSEIFYKEINVKKKNGTLTFAGSGPVHIGELKIEEQGIELKLDAGTYYINKFTISNKNFTVSLTDTPVIIHIGESFENKAQGSKINQSRSVDDLRIYLHSNAKFESTVKNLDFTGLIYGPNNVDTVKIAGQSNSINGAIIVSGGNIEVTGNNSTFTLSASEQSALASISTCIGGGGGGGDTPATAFNCVENGADGISGKLYTKTTSQSFSFDIVALQDASTIETSFASGTDHTVTVELVNAETAASCDSFPPLNPAVSQSLTMTAFDSGIKASTAMSSSTAYKEVKCRVTDPTGNPSVIGCSSDSFSIRPTTFSITSSQTNSGSTGLPIAKTGENFTLTATATSGYTGTPVINSSNIEAHAGAIQTGTVSGSFNAAIPGSGTATGNNFTYSEVGSLRFTAEGIYDDNFTAIDQSNDCTDDFSNTPVAGKVGCKFGNTTTSVYFGRFTPDHFVISNKNLEDRINRSCPSNSIFTYIGEQFQTSFTVTAENSSNNTTQNYTGSFAKLGGSDLNFGAIDLADAVAPISATALSSQLSLVSTSSSWTNGIANMTAALGITHTSPDGPFESFNLGIAPVDSDGVTVPNYDLDTSLPPDSNDRELLATTKIRFGRLNIENAHGSELLDLTVPMQTEYYNSIDFVTNTDDNCTPINISQLSFNGGTNPITVGSGTSTASIANSPLALGQAGLTLTAPGDTGFIDITSSTLITSYPWLSYDWDGDGNHDNSPSARATFGIYKGNSQQIYLREVY